MTFTADLLQEALSEPALVQSFSGVRARFGQGPGIPDELSALAVAYGFVYARWALDGRDSAEIVIGRDPRPTGAALTEALARGFVAGAKAAGCRLKLANLGIITTPLVETAVRALGAAGGVMITASHNPLTDNGFKFITGCPAVSGAAPPGALLSAPRMGRIVESVDLLSKDPSEVVRAVQALDEQDFRRAYGVGEDHERRVKAERAYLDSMGGDWGIQPHCLKPLVLGPALLDPNGGAACGIGARVLEHFGVRAIEVNAELGFPEHGIDTDNIDPASGKHMLIRVARAAARNSARFGIAFDYDADRGNLVLPGMDDAAIIHPQTVAAANIALALAHWQLTRPEKNRLAVVISDSTSGASAEVARMFNAEVHMVETGEINVVTRMHELRNDGYEVPIGVEGANGGSIFGKSTCRDGLQTAICVALADEQPELARQWLDVSGHNDHDTASTGGRLPAILAAMPVYYNRSFRLEGLPSSHAQVKAAIEEEFAERVWPSIDGHFRSYDFRNYEGTHRVDHRTQDESGGWRLCLESEAGQSFIFARGSRTEAGIFRMIVDSPDEASGELLSKAAVSLSDAAKRVTS